MRFEWDAHKAEVNIERHGISFEEAVAAFFDSDALDDYDSEHSLCERRYNLIGLSEHRLLFIVYAEPEDGVIRIVSARRAEKKHRRIYEQKG
jgi:uncharacterized DUF497 family protein